MSDKGSKSLSETGFAVAEVSRLLEPIRNPARFDRNEVTKVAHYYLTVDAMTRPMRVRETLKPYGEREP